MNPILHRANRRRWRLALALRSRRVYLVCVVYFLAGRKSMKDVRAWRPIFSTGELAAGPRSRGVDGRGRGRTARVWSRQSLSAGPKGGSGLGTGALRGAKP